MAQGTKVSAVPWMNRIGRFVFDTASSVDASLMEKPAKARVQTSISPSSGPAGSHFTCARRMLRMIASGEEKPQSAITPRTDGGSSSAEASRTVVAPIESPPRNSGCSGPKCMAAYCAHVAASRRS